MKFLSPKLKRNLFNFGDRISKEKNCGSQRIEILKYGKNFQFPHCFFSVRTEQKSKTEVRRQPFKCVP